ncbi:MAG: FAD-dependent oxidoreductase [Cyclobacteriaceae bacterium]
MNSALDIDLLIIGQGLAGSAVAMRAVSRGYKILVLDEPTENRSSLIAAGLFNPITGKNNVKTWLADEIFPSLHHFYREVEHLTKKTFFYSLPLYRPFVSAQEQNEWMGKSEETPYQDFIAGVSTGHHFGGKVNDPFGGITLKQSGYLDTRCYLESVREFLRARGAFMAERFESDKLAVDNDSVRYENIRAKRVIFCQGVQNAINPWFKMFPVNSLKGEFLTVQCDWQKDVILNRGVYLVPGASPEHWRAGATYNWNDHSPEITTRARKELTNKLGDLIRMPYTITGQQWGVRPTSPDRKPIIGAHPQSRSLIIFNGFGTKGVSLAPYFSEVLVRWMEKKGTINKEADVTRFN